MTVNTDDSGHLVWPKDEPPSADETAAEESELSAYERGQNRARRWSTDRPSGIY